ncbi:MAG: hypothetical protein BroJett039_02730 [Chloroflexota bacterium]|nr:MAG: hypothetical protein BroJett039_02730 [Chloroflexota bacterium]
MMNELTAPETRARYPKYARAVGIVSAVIALGCLAVIAALWMAVYTAPPSFYPDEIPLFTPTRASEVLDTNVPSDGTPRYDIPTGIFIQSVEFKGPYTLQTSGFLWQRYADTLPSDLDYGVLLPQAESATYTKVYETHQNNETLVGWSFKATMRQEFDYSKYPLDRQKIRFQMWHPDFERDVYLTPDIAGYANLRPETLPGVDSEFVIENWLTESSYFSYRLNRYNANFGIADYDSEQQTPELYFNINIKRGLLSPLISRLIVPLVILLQLFVIVLVIGTDHTRLEQFGVRPGAVIFTCAAFFFAVLVAENSLRDEVKAYGIVYLESVHLLTYLFILGVAVNSVLLVALPNLGLFRDNDNMWVEALYWPLFFGILCVVTALTFGALVFAKP